MTYKIITLKDRLNNGSNLCRSSARKIEQYLLQQDKVLDHDTDTVVSKLSYKLKPRTSLSKFKISDFKLENLIESGAIEQLKLTSNSRDKFTTISNISTQLDNISNTDSNNQ